MKIISKISIFKENYYIIVAELDKIENNDSFK